MTDFITVNHFHLFCGLGGGAAGFNQGHARIGAMEARFRCIGGVDSEPAAIADFGRLAGVPGTVLDLFDRDQYVKWLGHDLATALIEYAKLVGDSGTATMADLIDAYIVERLPALRHSTQKDYTHILTRLRAGFGAMLPHSLKPKDIYDYRNLWPGPRGNRHVAVLSSVMELGVEKGVVVHNPCREIKRRTEKARDRYVTDEEYLALFRFAPERLRIAMDLAVVTGLRLGDLISLRFQDLGDDGITIRTSKTNKIVPIEWTEDLHCVVDAAKAYQPGNVRALTLLVNSRGQRWTRDGFENAWQKLQRRAIKEGVLEERFQFRDLRSKATERAPDARALLGHTNEAVTRRHYIRHPQKVQPARKICPKTEFMPKTGESE